MRSGPIKILVGVDFSQSSESALSEAVDLARRLGGQIDLVHVCAEPVSALPEVVVALPPDMAQVHRLRAELSRVRDGIKDQLPTQIHLRVGDAVNEMLDLIEQIQPDLVVVGSHGRGALLRTLMGSVSERLCRRSPVPVLVIPAAGRIEAAREAREQHVIEAAGFEVVWSCGRCGHIRKRSESGARCSRCGAEPATWDSAPVTHQPADADEPTVGESVNDGLPAQTANEPSGLFPSSPPGTSGYDINPELRVRY